MQVEKPLFIEKELNRWNRPESPKPGTALVFVGNGKPSLVVYEGERGPTQGELLWGKYSMFYEIDMGERSLEFYEKLPCADALEFQAKVKVTYSVQDPIIIIRSARTDAGQFLRDSAIDVMRRTSRRYSYEQSGEAENAIAGRIEEEVRDKGFKLSRPVSVVLSLDEAISSRLVERQLTTFDFHDKKTQISRTTELNDLQQTAKLELKQKRAKIFAPLIKSGDWATLLAMLDPSDPEDEAIRVMIETTLNQQRIQAEKQQRMLEIAIEKGAIEGWQLEGVAKTLFKEISGISEQSIAFLEGKPESQKTDGSQQFPDEISREQDDLLENQ